MSRFVAAFGSNKERRDLERKVLAAAFKLSFEQGDTEGASLAHKGLCAILQQQLYDGDGSSGSVIPASVWSGAQSGGQALHAGQEPSENQSPAATKPEDMDGGVGRKAYASGKTISSADIESNAAAGADQFRPEATVLETVKGLTSQQLWEETCSTTTEERVLSAQELAESEVQTEAIETLSAADLAAYSFENSDNQPPAPAVAGEEPPVEQTLDPREIEEAFALLEAAATTGAAEAAPVETTGAIAPAADEPAPARGGEISAALERLTAAMTNEQTGETAASSAAGDNGGNADHGQHKPQSPPPETIALPVMERPMFEAPTPQLDLGDSGPAPYTVTNATASGPMTYLDFGDGKSPPRAPQTVPPADPAMESDEPSPSAELIAEMFAQAESQTGIPAQGGALPPMALTPSQLIRTQSFYQILGVNKLSSYEHIHVKFFRLVRRMLQTRLSPNSQGQDVREFREVLKHICVAHDILRDPVTRTDYDLRQLGMRGKDDRLETPADAGDSSIVPRTRLMIGELLEIANILDRTELQIALDMHKAEPGTMFGSFLVKAGFLNPEELDSALLGQRLISTGKITVAQFQTAMYRMRDHGPGFFDTLMVEGWLTPADMLNEAGLLQEKQAAPQPTPAAPQPEHAGGNGHDSAAVTAAAKLAESELLKSLESTEETTD